MGPLLRLQDSENPNLVDKDPHKLLEFENLEHLYQNIRGPAGLQSGTTISVTTSAGPQNFGDKAKDAIEKGLKNIYSKLPIGAWILIGIGVVLILLLVLYCCCKRCCRKKKKKQDKKNLKNAIDMQSVKDLADSFNQNALLSAEGGNESEKKSKEEVKQEFLGKLNYGFDYDFEKNNLSVKVIRAEELKAMDAGGKSDPYVKIFLSDDRKKKVETNVRRKELNPEFNETFNFKISSNEIGEKTVVFQVFDYDRFSQHDVIGQVMVHMSSVDLGAATEHWAELKPVPQKKQMELGKICVSLRYIPTSGKLTVLILEAKGLKVMDVGGSSDPFVKISLMMGNRRLKKKKTTVKKSTLNPYFNESFSFEVPFEQIKKAYLVIGVYDYDNIGSNDIIGRLMIGCDAEGAELRQWCDMLAAPRRPIAVWHTLKDLDKNYKIKGNKD